MNSASVWGDPRMLRASFKAPGVLWTSSTIAFLQFAFSAIKGKKREAIVRNGLSTRDEPLGWRGRQKVGRGLDCASTLVDFLPCRVIFDGWDEWLSGSRPRVQAA